VAGVNTDDDIHAGALPHNHSVRPGGTALVPGYWFKEELGERKTFTGYTGERTRPGGSPLAPGRPNPHRESDRLTSRQSGQRLTSV
jgi:hypothetical protein